MLISTLRSIGSLVLIVILSFCFQPRARAIEVQAPAELSSSLEKKVPPELSQALEEFIASSRQHDARIPETEMMSRVVDFVTKPKNPDIIYHMGLRDGAASNYSEFTINRSLKEVLDLVYNPDIPSHIVTPASIRRSRWLRINGESKKLPMLSDYLSILTDPVLINGVEFIENTPDTFSGAYYAYELDRALILARFKGRNVLISISQQRDKSDVGKKGLVLGNDDNWNYIYTGIKGCSRTGLGWVKSYMYDSASVTVYLEEKGPSARVRCGVFKWVHAGWAGINMVQPHHIRDGVARFSRNFKKIIESPNLEDIVQLSRDFEQIKTLSESQLRQKVGRYYLQLEELNQDKNRLARDWFEGLMGDDGYLANMETDEMRAVLELAYLKHLLGKPPGVDVTLIHPPKANTGSPG